VAEGSSAARPNSNARNKADRRMFDFLAQKMRAAPKNNGQEKHTIDYDNHNVVNLHECTPTSTGLNASSDSMPSAARSIWASRGRIHF
jgi:hypothetical protein